MAYKIDRLQAGDSTLFKKVILLFGEVFEMSDFQPPTEEYLESLLMKPDFFAFAAFEDDLVIGGLTGYLLPQYYFTKPLAYIYDMAVKTAFQRKGIGSQLIEATLNYCKSLGVGELFVQADDTDDYALEFYHSTGGLRGKAINFYYHIELNNETYPD